MPETTTKFPFKEIVCACFLAFAVLALDAWTKFAIYSTFNRPPTYLIEYPIFKDVLGIDFSLTYTPNSGAAWGFLSSWHTLLVGLRIATIAALCLYLFKFNRIPSQIIPLTLIIVGALGNVLDSFLYGHVVDMFLFTFWGHAFAVFNVADAAISLGVFWLFLEALFVKNSVHADSSSH